MILYGGLAGWAAWTHNEPAQASMQLLCVLSVVWLLLGGLR